MRVQDMLGLMQLFRDNLLPPSEVVFVSRLDTLYKGRECSTRIARPQTWCKYSMLDGH